MKRIEKPSRITFQNGRGSRDNGIGHTAPSQGQKKIAFVKFQKFFCWKIELEKLGKNDIKIRH